MSNESISNEGEFSDMVIPHMSITMKKGWDKEGNRVHSLVVNVEGEPEESLIPLDEGLGMLRLAEHTFIEMHREANGGTFF